MDNHLVKEMFEDFQKEQREKMKKLVEIQETEGMRGKTTEEMHQEIALAHKALKIALDYFYQYNQLPHTNQWGSVDFWINKARERLGLKLLPCPFCGSPAKKFVYTNSRTWSAIRCSNNNFCAARTDGWDTETEAIAAWNKRA